MKIAELKISVASALLFVTASTQALQPEVLHAFQLGPIDPMGNLVEGRDGNFYGVTLHGGNHGLGTVFRVTTNGLFTPLLSFTGTNGAYPEAGLVLGSDGHFYGTTSQGGSTNASGTVFRMTTNGVLTTLVSFTGPNGADPEGALVLGSDGHFYGTTANGGNTGHGTVFRMTTNGVLTSLVSFNIANGARPEAGLIQGNDGHLYGTTAYGGSGATEPWTGSGTVFKVTTNGVLTSLVSFNGVNGANPYAGLALGNDGSFYGTTYYGGSSGYGTVFKVTTNGAITSLVSFDYYTNGATLLAGLVLGTDGSFYGTTYQSGTYLGGPNGYGTVFKVTTNGILTTLVSFNLANGAYPYSGLALGSDGNFYGTTSQSGSSYVNPAYEDGTVFKMTPNGVLTTLTSSPTGPNELLLGRDGNLYGTTFEGGSSGYGTVFKVTTSGVLTTLVSFAGTNGASPDAALVMGSDDNFYGTTWRGGSSDAGTVFQMTPNGILTSLVSFTGTNGANPRAELVPGNDGNFYGTTESGGSSGLGTVFKVTTNGLLTTFVSFTGLDGEFPRAGLVLGEDGSFYGTTSEGGTNSGGTVFRLTTNGVLTTLVAFSSDYFSDAANPEATMRLGRDGNFYGTTAGYTRNLYYKPGRVFRLTTSGVLTFLASLTGHNGSSPHVSLISGSDGSFYGTTTGTTGWGTSSFGTVFRVTTNGMFTSFVSFTGDNGANPRAGLVLGRDGNFYGTTANGGPGGGGTIFRLVISEFTSMVRQPNGSMLLTGTGPANGGYRLWASTDLSLPLASWTVLTSASFDSNGNLSYTDASAATNSSRFYQLSVP